MTLYPSAMARLCEALNVPANTLSLQLQFEPSCLATMTVERILTTEEIEALADWYETEGLTAIPASKTTYNLVRKEEQTLGSPAGRDAAAAA